MSIRAAALAATSGLLLASTTFAADEPRYGGTITLATLEEPKCLDPAFGGDVPQDIIAHQFLDNLVSQDQDGGYKPWLAKSWDISTDGRQYTFHLRDDVKFTDGTPLNAAAIKVNFEHWLDPATGSGNVGPELADYISADVVDDRTVAIKLKNPNAFFLTILSNPETGIQSPAGLARGNEKNCLAPIGTGPFVVSGWDRGNAISFTRNEDYNWGPPQATHQGKAYAEKVEWRVIGEPATRYNALAAGEISVINGLPPENFTAAKASDDVKVVEDSQPGVPWQLDLNTKRAPFSDIRVRQAFRHAVDASSGLKSVFFGACKAAGGPLSPSTPFYDAAFENAYPYDIKQADKLLDEAGWKERDANGYRTKDGKRLKAYFPVNAAYQPADLALFEQVQATVKKAGFELVIDKLDTAVAHQHQYDWDYDIYIDYWTANTPDTLKIIYHSDGLKALTGGYHNNEVGISDPHLDKLLETGAQTNDRAAAQKIYSEAQKFISDEALSVPLYVYPSLAAYNTQKVRGIRSDWSIHSVTLYDAWVPQD